MADKDERNVGQLLGYQPIVVAGPSSCSGEGVDHVLRPQAAKFLLLISSRKMRGMHVFVLCTGTITKRMTGVK